jgi:hypothetical protein
MWRADNGKEAGNNGEEFVLGAVVEKGGRREKMVGTPPFIPVIPGAKTNW